MSPLFLASSTRAPLSHTLAASTVPGPPLGRLTRRPEISSGAGARRRGAWSWRSDSSQPWQAPALPPLWRRGVDVSWSAARNPPPARRL